LDGLVLGVSLLAFLGLPLLWVLGLVLAYFHPRHARPLLVFVVAAVTGNAILWWAIERLADEFGPPRGEDAVGGALFLGFYIIQAAFLGPTGIAAYWLSGRRASNQVDEHSKSN
jgi:hypothetical protein